MAKRSGHVRLSKEEWQALRMEQERARRPNAARSAAATAFIQNNSPRRSNKRLEADCSGSECFDELTWEDGVVTAVFADKKGTVETYAMTRCEALDWFMSESLGSTFNDEIR